MRGPFRPEELRATLAGVAKSLHLVIPEVDGILGSLAYSLPTPTVSVVEDVTLVNEKTNRDEVNAALRHWAGERFKGITDVTEDPWCRWT